MTTATIEFTAQQIAHRKACALLKGIICGYTDRKGRPYQTTKPRTPEFDAGFKLGREERFTRGDITGFHIAHNHLRHNRPHTENCGTVCIDRFIDRHLGEACHKLALEQVELDKTQEERAA
jgi:hypothetical protein